MGRRIRTKAFVAAAVMLSGIIASVGGLESAGASGQATRQSAGQAVDYIVLAPEGASTAGTEQAVRAAGGTVTETNADVGMVRATSTNPAFATQIANKVGVTGVARDSVIGSAPRGARTQKDLERVEAERRASTATSSAATSGATSKHRAAAAPDPLTPLQWDMKAIHADQAHNVLVGDHRTKVGIIDTGIDGTHPDIAPNFDASLSRNFTVDIPLIDGPCEVPSCHDPANVDEDGHGTHVAGTIGSPRNGLGIEGVAPGVDLVNVRAGQDSGYFFIGPTVDALTYAANVGIDVVNMSFYIDPWLYNCRANPADSHEAQIEQRTIIQATQRALRYAHRKGVTLIAAMGNEDSDLGHPTFDDTSPDYPPDAAYDRTVDNSCLNLPTEGANVISVTSTGPSGRKAYYSNYGTEQADIAAPGGDYRDFPNTDKFATVGNLILAPYPEAVARATGDIDASGNPTTDFVVKDCTPGTCSYYQYLQGTSMASPHAVGVAALVIARNGHRTGAGFGLNPNVTEALLYRTANPTACPTPATYVYPLLADHYTATCEGTTAKNGFYGRGEVDALNAALGAPGSPQPAPAGAVTNVR